MKKNFLLVALLLASLFSFSQGYQMSLDSARLLSQKAKGEEKFFAIRRLDRYYYTTGFYDSSALLQKQMYELERLKDWIMKKGLRKTKRCASDIVTIGFSSPYPTEAH
jgi:hypothetical protein